MAELTILSNQCGVLDVSFGPSEMSGPSLGEPLYHPQKVWRLICLALHHSHHLQIHHILQFHHHLCHIIC